MKVPRRFDSELRRHMRAIRDLLDELEHPQGCSDMSLLSQVAHRGAEMVCRQVALDARVAATEQGT